MKEGIFASDESIIISVTQKLTSIVVNEASIYVIT